MSEEDDYTNMFGPRGVGGWLVPLGISLLLAAFVHFTILRVAVHQLVSVGGNAYSKSLTAYFAVIFFWNLFLIVAFFRKAEIFLKGSIYFLLMHIVITTGFCFYRLNTGIDPPDFYKDWLLPVLPAAVWTIYLLVSKRAENTFVNRLIAG